MRQAYETIEIQRQSKAQNVRHVRERALSRIAEILGKRAAYTFGDAEKYLTEVYGAVKISFADALGYIPNKYHIIEQCKASPDAMSMLTENWLSDKFNNLIFLLPPLQEQTSSMRAPKNGCILIIENVDDMPSNWWIGGNKDGYDSLYNSELYILCNGSKGSYCS